MSQRCESSPTCTKAVSQSQGRILKLQNFKDARSSNPAKGLFQCPGFFKLDKKRCPLFKQLSRMSVVYRQHPESNHSGMQLMHVHILETRKICEQSFSDFTLEPKSVSKQIWYKKWTIKLPFKKTYRKMLLKLESDGMLSYCENRLCKKPC